MKSEDRLMPAEVLTTRGRELYNMLIGVPTSLLSVLPGELVDRMREIDKFFGPVTSGEISIARAEFRQDAVVRWIMYLHLGEATIEWPKLE